MRAYVLAGLAVLSLAACGGGGGWQKQSASPEQSAEDLAECKAEARSVLQRDTAIDADILASRSYDWQKSNTLATRQESMRATNRVRSDEIIGRCMTGKGYVPAVSGD